MAMVPKLRVFASHWGTAPRFGNKFLELLDGLKAEGFAGIELSLGDLGPDAAARDAAVGAIGERGLRAIIGAYSGWVDYEGAWARAAPGAHLRTLAAQLDAVAALPPGVVAHVNVHGGCDTWDEATARGFLAEASGLAAEFLEKCPSVGAAHRARDAVGSAPAHPRGVSFETHRGRCLFSPWATLRYLERVEPLRLTADVSHWHVVAERLLDDGPTAALLDGEVAPFVDHLHARIGGENRPQLPARPRYYTDAEDLGPPFGNDDDPRACAAVRAHVRLWRAVWDAKRRDGAAEVFATPEYGPPPYQTRPTGRSVDPNDQSLYDQTLDAKFHLEQTFAQWAKGA